MGQKSQNRQIYSALEVAKLCGVVNQTSINWIKAGHLKAFKTPGGQYRVYPEDLADFMASRKMQIPQEVLDALSTQDGSQSEKILIVDDDKGINTVLAKYLEKTFEGVEIFQAFDGFEAGALCSQAKPGFACEQRAPASKPSKAWNISRPSKFFSKYFARTELSPLSSSTIKIDFEAVCFLSVVMARTSCGTCIFRPRIKSAKSSG